jgi:hypothetical protein
MWISDQMNTQAILSDGPTHRYKVQVVLPLVRCGYPRAPQ